NPVGGCGGPEFGVRAVNLGELPESPSSGGTRSHGEVKRRAGRPPEKSIFFSVKHYVMGTPSLVRGQVQSARRSDHRTGNKGFLDGTSGLPRRRDGEMENRETRKYTRAIFGDGQPPGGQRRLKNDSAARCLDTSRSDQPRAVRNEGRARPDRRGATSPRPGRSDQSRPHPDRQVGRMVGV